MKHWVDDNAMTGAAATAGIVEGTKIATSMGWRAVEAIAEGDLVLTFDNGMRPVTGVQRLFYPDHGPRHWPLAVPAGALGNTAPLMLTPGQAVMLESDLAEGLTGDPFVVIEAAALDGHAGITRCRPARMAMVVVLQFEEEEVVFSQPGALLHCPAGGDFIANLFADAPAAAPYDVLTGHTARAFLADLAGGARAAA